MSQERWDVVLRFLDGSLAYQGDIVMRGPVVRIGAKPGPGGLQLEGYRGLDDRQAVITAYDGGTASVAPVGSHQVRMAPHEHVVWDEVQPIRGPVFLSPGCAIHFGPPGRGATCTFVECRRLGTWEQKRILSDATQGAAGTEPTEVKDIDARSRFPWWLVPSMGLVVSMFSCSFFTLVFVISQRDVYEIGPVDEGVERIDLTENLDEAIAETAKIVVDTKSYEGISQAFANFVMLDNARAAKNDKLATDKTLWDATLLNFVARSVKGHASAWAFWTRLESVQNEYAYVLGAARKAGLPDVLAAIPYQESGYTPKAQSYVCAKGWWQFLPEVAVQAGIEVQNCTLTGSPLPWTPTRMSPVIGVIKNSVYMSEGQCRIPRDQGCAIDGRTDLEDATAGALKLLGEAFRDEEIADSGAAVQITIASHNSGYDNSRFDEKRKNLFNQKHAYHDYITSIQATRAPDYIGKNMTCLTGPPCEGPNDRGGGFLGKETQAYVHLIIAQHILAACYYGLNYSSEKVFEPYAKLNAGTGYCTGIDVPSKDKTRARLGKKASE